MVSPLRVLGLIALVLGCLAAAFSLPARQPGIAVYLAATAPTEQEAQLIAIDATTLANRPDARPSDVGRLRGLSTW